MRRKALSSGWIALLITVNAGFFAPTPAWSFDGFNRINYSPKLGLQVGYGTLNNGSISTTGMAFRGIGIWAAWFFWPKVALGMGYMSDSPFSAMRAFGRYYFWGQGTRTLSVFETSASERRDKYAAYGGLEGMQRDYSYTILTPPISQEGTVSTTSVVPDKLAGNVGTLNVLLGADYMLSSHLELNAEANIGVLSIYTSDSRINVLGYVFLIGLGYVW